MIASPQNPYVPATLPVWYLDREGQASTQAGFGEEQYKNLFVVFEDLHLLGFAIFCDASVAPVLVQRFLNDMWVSVQQGQ